MKRFLYILLLIVFITVLAAPTLAGSDWRYLETKFTREAPDEFVISSFPSVNTEQILHKFQNNIGFYFIDREEITEEFTVSTGTTDNYDEYHLNFNLTYNKNSLKNYDDVFITGTFDYMHNANGTVDEFSGEVIGQIVLINPNHLGLLGSDSDDVGAIVIRLKAEDEGFSVNFFLNPSGTGLLISDPDYEAVSGDSGYMSHESRPHIPSPWQQADVAAGVGLSTIGIVIVNALTKTSVFGNASFNGSFDPTSASPGGQTPSAGTGGSSASAASAVQSSAPATGTSGATSSSGGFIGVIKDFFKNLFANLRDMLTDEGRSYANGKLSETLENVIPDDIDNE